MSSGTYGNGRFFYGVHAAIGSALPCFWPSGCRCSGRHGLCSIGRPMKTIYVWYESYFNHEDRCSIALQGRKELQLTFFFPSLKRRGPDRRVLRSPPRADSSNVIVSHPHGIPRHWRLHLESYSGRHLNFQARTLHARHSTGRHYDKRCNGLTRSPKKIATKVIIW